MLEVFVIALFLIPASIATIHLFGLTSLGWWPRRRSLPASSPQDDPSFAVIIPAHNEELGLPRTLRALAEADYPAHRIHTLVVADNCDDATMSVARNHGVECLERTDPVNRGKGYALAMAIPHVLAAKPDAVLILDADCETAPNLFRRFAEELAQGSLVLQAARIPRNGSDNGLSLVSAVGSVIENAISAGRSRLGRPVTLRGSGMAFAREVLERRPWESFGLVEDAEYTHVLEQAGVRVQFVPDAVVTGEVPVDAETLAQQRRRWRAATWSGGPGLLSRFLASKPLVLLHLLLTVATVITLSRTLPMDFLIWAGVLLLLTGSVYVRALRRCDGFRWGSLFTAMGMVPRLASVTLAGAWDRGRVWERTRRIGE